eukprot:11615509-Alexandrium_andersonii.AAC.1
MAITTTIIATAATTTATITTVVVIIITTALSCRSCAEPAPRELGAGPRCHMAVVLLLTAT